MKEVLRLDHSSDMVVGRPADHTVANRSRGYYRSISGNLGRYTGNAQTGEFGGTLVVKAKVSGLPLKKILLRGIGNAEHSFLLLSGESPFSRQTEIASVYLLDDARAPLETA